MKHQPRKRFGQNFLIDENIIHEIIQSINPRMDDNLVEIGPGLGALTKEILPLAHKLDVIELDRDLSAKLKVIFSAIDKLIIHNADALKFDFSKLISSTKKENNKLRIFGNLPYNITTPLIFHLLKFIDFIKDMHFMVQDEVAERLSAKPNNKSYGKLSVMVQYFCDVEKLFIVPPDAFHPKPKVYSSIINLKPQKILIPTKNINLLEKIVTHAFATRRKTIFNNLKNLINKDDFHKLNIDLNLRAENISVADYVKISNYIFVKGEY